MKHIHKTNPPASLENWRSNTVDPNRRYEDLPPDIKENLLSKLLSEQGFLCGYTGERVSPDNSHIEHINPQSKCNVGLPDDDTNYTNMIAAHPKPGVSCKFGAVKKGDWYEPEKFVSPLHGGCESRFRFKLDGTVKPTKSDDVAAEETIAILQLNDGDLKGRRRAIIDQYIFGIQPVKLHKGRFRRPDPALSKKQLQVLKQTACTPDAQGKLKPFCFVLVQACDQLLKG